MASRSDKPESENGQQIKIQVSVMADAVFSALVKSGRIKDNWNLFFDDHSGFIIREKIDSKDIVIITKEVNRLNKKNKSKIQWKNIIYDGKTAIVFY